MTDLLHVAAERAAGDPFFLAAALARVVEANGLDDLALAQGLDCPVANLDALRLCRSPGWAGADFWSDISTIAERFGVDGGALADMILKPG